MTGNLQVVQIRTYRLHGDPANRPDGSGEENLPGMAATIRVLGVLEPLLVEDMTGRPGHYLIRAGHLRKAAAEMAGLSEVPCIVRRPFKATGAVTSALYAVVENFHRTAMSPVETALRLGTLLGEGMSQAEIARFTGMKDSTISYHLELLELDEPSLNKVRRGDLPVGAAHEAVRQARAAGPQPGTITLRPQRAARRGPGPKRPKAPPYWTAKHPLAADAFALCERYGHEAWTRIGKVACGPCWQEAVIDAHTPPPGEILASLGLTLADITPEALTRIGLADNGDAPATVDLVPVQEWVNPDTPGVPPRPGWQVRCSRHGLLEDGYAYALRDRATAMQTRHQKTHAPAPAAPAAVLSGGGRA